MKLSELGEFRFIDRIARSFVGAQPDHVLRGIGDDAAVIEGPDGVLLVTTDMLMERVHFLRDTITPRQLGRKSLAVSLSDIAAMGGVPQDAFVSLAIPDSVTVEELDGFYSGLQDLAEATNVKILGGDTSASVVDLCVNILVIGRIPREQVLYRSGASVGDRVVVTGTLGDSAGGRAVLTNREGVPDAVCGPLIRAHVEPELYLDEARAFAASGIVHAAIDLSDGLASDLHHICRESRVGAVIESTAIPLSAELMSLCRITGADPLALAVDGGEDYRLLITVEPDAVDDLAHQVSSKTGRTLYEIGEIVDGDSVILRSPDGNTRHLLPSGWDHFSTHGEHPDSSNTR